MGGEELHGLRAVGTAQGNGAAAQHIGEQVGQRAVRAHGHALTIDVVVPGRGPPCRCGAHAFGKRSGFPK